MPIVIYALPAKGYLILKQNRISNGGKEAVGF